MFKGQRIPSEKVILLLQIISEIFQALQVNMIVSYGALSKEGGGQRQGAEPARSPAGPWCGRCGRRHSSHGALGTPDETL